MGYADREYFREGGGRPPSRLAGAPVVKWLLIVNLGVFLLGLFVEGPDKILEQMVRDGADLDRDAKISLAEMKFWGAAQPKAVPAWKIEDRFKRWDKDGDGFLTPGEVIHPGVFTVTEGLYGFQVWRLVTFQFLHADFGHLFFNSIAIYFFGAFVEQQLRSRAFLFFYLLCGVAGALGASLLGLFQGDFQWQLVGASAGVFGILAVAALIAPKMQVRLLIPPVTLTMRQLAIILLGIGVLTILLGGRNAGGEAGHLGGALAGFLFWKVPILRELLGKLGSPGGRGSVTRPGFQIRIKKSDKRYEKKLRPRMKDSGRTAAEVDRILDKINEHGLQSLTEEERALLSDSGKK